MIIPFLKLNCCFIGAIIYRNNGLILTYIAPFIYFIIELKLSHSVLKDWE